jgi:hypothetical protein
VGIQAVYFFTGKPAGDRLPPGAAPAAANPLDPARQVWIASLTLPKDRNGPTEVSVQFVNQHGQSAFATTSIDLQQPDAKPAKGGTIRGKVLDGNRLPMGLTVLLSDERGAEKGRATTAAGGAYEFTDLPPGKYRVTVARPASGRSGSSPRDPQQFITVEPGTTATANVVLAPKGG